MAKKENISLKEYFKIITWSLGIGFKLSKGWFLIYIITSIFLELRSLFYAYFFARVIDDAINLATQGSAEIVDILQKLSVIFLFNIIFIVVKGVNKNVDRKLNFASRTYQREYEFTKIYSLGLQTLQDPTVNKLRDSAQRWLSMTDYLNRRLVIAISNIVLFIVSAIYLFNILPWLIPAFLIYAVVLFIEERYFFKKDFYWQTNDKNTEEKNKKYYTARILSSANYIEEISIVGGFNFLANKFKKFFKYYNEGLYKIINNQRVFAIILDLVDTALIFIGYIRIFIMLINGQISVGTTTFYMSIIDNFDRSLGNLSSAIVTANDFVTKLSKVYEFYSLKPKVKDGSIILPRLKEPPSIEFRNVQFTYPNTENVIFDDFNLTIKSGEKIAIVGPNGAGKSTLTKLIARLYDPLKGKILINNKNLIDLKIDDWYKNVGLLFQDFKIYDPLTVEENIYIGKTAKPLNKELIIESAKNADAHDFIMKYPKKYQTFMNERYEDGIQPSKGQKQKIAISRFFYRDAPLAIFDEPTSAIDAESEYRIFNRIYEFFNNKTVIIISHRFSTVRNADRIIVLDKGKIVEEGSHSELMSLNGQYAKAFRLQAEGYQD
jgi:ATP-binding cassette subfamily B protein